MDNRNPRCALTVTPVRTLLNSLTPTRLPSREERAYIVSIYAPILTYVSIAPTP